MAKDMSFTVQGVLYTVLVGDSALMTKINEVYDVAPEGAALPYVTIGQDVAKAWDTKSKDGQVFDVNVHSFSAKENFAEAKGIAEEVYRLLKNMSFLLGDGTLVRSTYLQTVTTVVRRQAVDVEQKFRVFVQK
jgi:hypothetical protein